VTGTDLGWAATLHRLWSSVASITSREDLAELVLPPLLTLPGAVAVWGLRRGSGGTVLAYRSAGLPLEGDAREIAVALAATGREITPVAAVAAPEGEWLRARGVHHVVVAELHVPNDPDGTFLMLLGAAGDPELSLACMRQVVDATREAAGRVALRRADEDQQVRDALLAEASLQMDAVLDITETMRRVARMAVPAIAEGCLLYATANDKPELRSAVHVDMRRLSAALRDEATAARLLETATEAIAGVPPRRHTGVLGARILDAQVLTARGRVVGVLILMYERDADRVPPPSFLRDLAHRAALAIDNGELYEQRRREMIAMQMHLLPGGLPSADGVELAASYVVGDQVTEVGGDFYDVVRRSDGVLGALIGDVCGRGVAAAALTGMSRHTLAALLQEGVSPGRALRRLNSGLRRARSWRFVTAGVALIRPVAGGLSVQWSSCGHPPPVIMRAAGPAEPGRGGGVPLGVLPQASVGVSRVRLGAGDTLLTFTDGLTESRDRGGRMFEDAALWETLEALRDRPLDALVHELSAAATGFGTNGADDIAVLAIRAKGPGDA
jgi:serine phosphatase RsbU (regulator of sigma subunit)